METVVVRTNTLTGKTTRQQETVILNLERDGYYGLNQIGSHIWQLLDEPRSVSGLCDLLLEEYEVSREQCQQDLLHYLETLAASHLIDIIAGPAPPPLWSRAYVRALFRKRPRLQQVKPVKKPREFPITEPVSQLKSFLRWPHRYRLLFFEAFVWLGLARMVILLLPFRRVVPVFGTYQAESPKEAIPEDIRSTVLTIFHAVRCAAQFTPWKSVCLPQAMAAKMMLQRRHIPSTMYLGMAKQGEDSFCAHA
ncbi:MAG: lasso peptide biosynthesis B2 protein [bacterium]|nr:lasso peptide biosynthesis B2 protein [bacterium]